MHLLFTARPTWADCSRSRLARSLLSALLLAASVAVAGVFVSTPASAAPDPLTCNGYPEERVFLESHAWWQPVLNGDEDFGHLHTETCFPRTHDRNGNVQKITGTLQLDVRVVMHDNPGTLDWLRIQVSGDGFNNVGFHRDMNETCTGADDPDWDAHMGACTWWVRADVDTTVAGADGFNELRVSAKVEEPNGDEMRNSTGWQAYLANGKSVKHYRSDTGAFTEGRGWYEGAGYAIGRLADPIPHEVSGTWTPNVVVDEGSGGVDVARSRVMVDPRFHHGDEGWKVLDQAGSYRGRISIDTTKLADGLHRLYIQALAPCDGSSGNDCGTKADGSDNNVSTNAGAQVIPFVVNNGGGAAPEPEPTHEPTHEPEPDPTTEPEPDPTTEPEPDPVDDPTAEPQPEPHTRPTVHVADVDANVRGGESGWSGTVFTQLHDDEERPVADAVVRLQFTVNGRDEEATCRTGDEGWCDVTVTFPERVRQVSVEVVDVESEATYVAASNHDPDSNTPGAVQLRRP
jgi:hypothetical protein